MGWELAGLGRGTRMQEVCKLFGCAKEPTQVREGGGIVAREVTTTTTAAAAAAAAATIITTHQWHY